MTSIRAWFAQSIFADTELLALYGAQGIRRIGLSLVSVFVPIFLWEMGYALWQIFLFFFLQSSSFVALAFLLPPVMRRMTDKTLIFLALPLAVIFFTGLNFLEEMPFLFLVLSIADALRRLFWGAGFSLDFSYAVDDGYIGRQVGVTQIIVNAAAVAGPLVGAFIAYLFGFEVLFWVGGAIILSAVIPVLAIPRHKLASAFSARLLLRYVFKRSVWRYALSEIGYATETLVGRVVWPIFIFITVGGLNVFGVVVSVGYLFGSVFQYVVGYYSDTGWRGPILRVTTYLYALIWATRPFFGVMPTVAGSNIAGRVLLGLLIVPWAAMKYELAQHQEHRGVFVLSRVVVYHMARMAFWPILIALAYFLSTELFFVISFFAAAVVSLLYLFAQRQMT